MMEKAEEYPWSSARAHVLGNSDYLLSGEIWLSEKERSECRDFFEQDSEGVEKTIHERTSNGCPLGGEQFAELLEQKCGHMLRFGNKGRPRWGSEKYHEDRN